MAGLFDEMLAAYDALTPAEQAELDALIEEETGDMLWVNNPGPQAEAVECLADELFYGGQAGGGKTDLLIGLALSRHEKSLLLRRANKEVIGLEERLEQILGSRAGLNSQTHVWRGDGRTIEMGGCLLERDKQNYKGRPHDFIGFDEIADFSESQYRFITAWNRSAKPGQRSRVVCTGNPPTTAEGFWVIRYWAAWLDPTHPNPAREGELRWYTTIDGREVECDGPTPVQVNGQYVTPRSRTFIRSRLADNPDLEASGYDSVLAALPPELRDAYREGRFDAVQKDQPSQLFPTAWVKAAMARWDAAGGDDIPMSVLSHDVAFGGGDANTWARRHAYWYDEILTETLKGEVDPIDLASRDMALMRDGCPIVVDVGGGYGAGVLSHLKQHVRGLKLYGHNGSGEAGGRDRSGKLAFANKRAMVHWKFREALEPGLGVPIALPPDPELLADLTSLTWKLTARGILVEDKVELRKRLGRSPDKGDAVVNAWSYGEDGTTTHLKVRLAAASVGKRRVNLGHASMKAKLRRNR